MSTDFTDLVEVRCPLLEQPTNDMCVGDLVKLLAYNTAVLERTLLDNVVPAGVISYYSGSLSEIPAGLLVCDGSFYEPETYPELFESIHYSHGRAVLPDIGFAVPDLRVSIIQGMALSSDTMEDEEQDLWVGNEPLIGSPISGDYVGASISHKNTEDGGFVTAGSRYFKVAMIPVISTGEICNREEITSTSTRPCSITGLSLHTLAIDNNELCILNEFGAVNNCIQLPIPDYEIRSIGGNICLYKNGVSISCVTDGGEGGGGFTKGFKKTYLDTPIAIIDQYDGSLTTTIDLNTLTGVTVPWWATHAIVKARTSAYVSGKGKNVRSTVNVMGTVVSQTIVRAGSSGSSYSNYTYGGLALGVDADGANDEEIYGNESNVVPVPLDVTSLDIIITKEVGSGSSAGGSNTAAAYLYLYGFEGDDTTPLVIADTYRRESFEPILIDFEDSGAVSGIRNFDISTLSGNGLSAGAIDIPTWATNVLLKGTMRTTAPYASTMYIDDIPFLEMENFGLSSDNVIGHNVLIDSFPMLSGSNIEYEFEGNGLSSSSFFKLQAVGFEGYVEGTIPPREIFKHVIKYTGEVNIPNNGTTNIPSVIPCPSWAEGAIIFCWGRTFLASGTFKANDILMGSHQSTGVDDSTYISNTAFIPFLDGTQDITTSYVGGGAGNSGSFRVQGYYGNEPIIVT